MTENQKTVKKKKEIVLDILCQSGRFGIRTDRIMMKALNNGICNCDRYLRWLVEEGKAICEWKEGDRAKTWYSMDFVAKKFDKDGQGFLI